MHTFSPLRPWALALAALSVVVIGIGSQGDVRATAVRAQELRLVSLEHLLYQQTWAGNYQQILIDCLRHTESSGHAATE